MPRAIRGLLAVTMVSIGVACGTTSVGTDTASGARPASRMNLIMVEELEQRGQYSNLYDLIRTLRPRWLRSQGPDALMGDQGQVQVRMDGNHLGGVDAMRNLAAAGVTTIEWLPPIDAAARFGLDHGHGVIIISTAPVH